MSCSDNLTQITGGRREFIVGQSAIENWLKTFGDALTSQYELTYRRPDNKPGHAGADRHHAPGRPARARQRVRAEVETGSRAAVSAPNTSSGASAAARSRSAAAVGVAGAASARGAAGWRPVALVLAAVAAAICGGRAAASYAIEPDRGPERPARHHRHAARRRARIVRRPRRHAEPRSAGRRRRALHVRARARGRDAAVAHVDPHRAAAVRARHARQQRLSRQGRHADARDATQGAGLCDRRVRRRVPADQTLRPHARLRRLRRSGARN